MKYSRKPEVVEAEQVDLQDPAQMARLLISVYQGPLGIEGSVQVDPFVRARIQTGDWLIIPSAFPAEYKKVMSDAEFKAKYAPVPGEVEFPPEVYQALRERGRDPKVAEEIRKLEEEEDRDENLPPHAP